MAAIRDLIEEVGPATCACSLRAGQAKRLPARPAGLLGYVIGCPRCGWKIEVEDNVTHESPLTVTGVRCPYCTLRFDVRANRVMQVAA